MSWLDDFASKIAAKVVQTYTGVPSQVSEPVIKGAMDAAGTAKKNVQKGSSKSKKQGAPEFDPAQFTPSAGEVAAYDVALPIVGDITKAVGGTLAARNSILGAALQAVHNSNAIDNTVQGDANVVNKMMGAGFLGKAAGQKILSDIVANRAYNLADTGKQYKAQERAMQYQAEQGAPGLFYQYMGNTAKSMPTVAPDVNIDALPR